MRLTPLTSLTELPTVTGGVVVVAAPPLRAKLPAGAVVSILTVTDLAASQLPAASRGFVAHRLGAVTGVVGRSRHRDGRALRPGATANLMGRRARRTCRSRRRRRWG